MFKNRKLEVRMVNTNQNQPAADTRPPDVALEDTMTIFSWHLGKLINKAGTVALGYIAVDTLRQVIVARALKR